MLATLPPQLLMRTIFGTRFSTYLALIHNASQGASEPCLQIRRLPLYWVAVPMRFTSPRLLMFAPTDADPAASLQ